MTVQWQWHYEVFLYFHSNFPFHKIDKFLWDDRISLVKSTNWVKSL